MPPLPSRDIADIISFQGKEERKEGKKLGRKERGREENKEGGRKAENKNKSLEIFYQSDSFKILNV